MSYFAAFFATRSFFPYLHSSHSSCALLSTAQVNDTYTVLLREKKLPLQLLQEPPSADERRVGAKAARSGLLATQPFGETFGAQRRRKRPKLAADGLEALVQQAEAREGE